MLYFVSDLLLAVSEITTVSTTIRRHFVKHALTLLHNAQWSLQNRIFLYLTWNVEVWIACRNIPHMPKILIFVLFKFISTNLHTQLYNLYAITWSYAHTYTRRYLTWLLVLLLCFSAVKDLNFSSSLNCTKNFIFLSLFTWVNKFLYIP